MDGLGGVLFRFPFRVPAYYALILRSLTVLEGLALQADRDYKLLGKAYPYMAKRLLIDPAPELRWAAALAGVWRPSCQLILPLLSAPCMCSEASRHLQARLGADGKFCLMACEAALTHTGMNLHDMQDRLLWHIRRNNHLRSS